MKILTLLFILILFAACNDTADETAETLPDTTQTEMNAGGDEEIPQNLKDAFNDKYANATEVEWEKDDMEYEVEFVWNDEDYEVEYDLEGNFIKEAKRIENNILPKAVMDKLTSEYAGWQIEDAEEINAADGGKYFELELEQGDQEQEIVIDENGVIRSKDM